MLGNQEDTINIKMNENTVSLTHQHILFYQIFSGKLEWKDMNK